LVEIGASFFSAHELGGHFLVPGALGFIEDDDMITRWTNVAQSGVAKVMNVLYEGFDLLFISVYPCSSVVQLNRSGSESTRKQVAQAIGIALRRRVDTVRVGFREVGVRMWRFSRDKDRINRSAVTGAVKVLQIQSVIPNLVQVVAKKFGFANLEFDWTYRGTGDEDCVETSSNSRNVEFQENSSLNADQTCLKELDLRNPGITLIRVDRESAVGRDLSQNGPTIRGEKRPDVSRVV
jgi:hypothetical protein